MRLGLFHPNQLLGLADALKTNGLLAEGAMKQERERLGFQGGSSLEKRSVIVKDQVLEHGPDVVKGRHRIGLQAENPCSGCLTILTLVHCQALSGEHIFLVSLVAKVR